MTDRPARSPAASRAPAHASRRVRRGAVVALALGLVGGCAPVPWLAHLRAEASQLTFEVRYRLGESLRVPTQPFGVERGDRPAPGPG